MMPPAFPANEQERLSDLYEYNILDTLPEKEFDDITRIASQICQTPISTVSIIDADRQWFKSKQGIVNQETPREISFCAHAILNPQELFIVPDATKDLRFQDYPNVTGEPHIAFYAGAPLISESGFPLGTLCVIDNKPREINEGQKEALKALANQVVCLLELRRKKEELAQSHEELRAVNSELEKFAYVVAHDLKSPCNNIISLSNILRDDHAGQLDHDAVEMLSMMEHSSYSMKTMIDGILRHAKTAHALKDEKESFLFGDVMKEVLEMIEIPEGVLVHYTQGEDRIWSVKSAFRQILLNLCTNAINYNDKVQAIVKVSFDSDHSYYRFTVSDNGIGIPESEKDNIFELFHTLDQVTRSDKKGTGIGLNTVKTLVEKLGGKIRVTSEPGVGTSFTVSIKK